MSQNTQLFNTDGEPNSRLLQLLELLEVNHDGTLKDIARATQAAWFENEILVTNRIEHLYKKRADAMPMFADLGFVKEVNPQCEYYLHALVLGDTLTRIRKRLAFLQQKWNEGLRFFNLYLIANRRLLAHDTENKAAIFNPHNADLPYDPPNSEPTFVPQNEADLMSVVYAQAENRFPWSGIKMHLVYTNDIDDRPANTKETLTTWHNLSPMSGKCLIVSSQPYVQLHQRIGQRVFSRRHVRIDCIGYDAFGATMHALLNTLGKLCVDLSKK